MGRTNWREIETKRLALASVVMALMVVLFAVAAVAKGLPTSLTEADAYNEDGSRATNARVWLLDDGWETNCNVTPRIEAVTVRAYVAQWARWKMDYSGWEWYVKKPGTFYADCITAEVQSNGDVEIKFSGAGNLKFENGPVGRSNENPIGTTVNTTIKTWYAATESGKKPRHSDEGEDPWLPLNKLNGLKVRISDSRQLHKGLRVTLWNKIEVVECNSVGMYENEFEVKLVLSNQVDWIDKFDKPT